MKCFLAFLVFTFCGCCSTLTNSLDVNSPIVLETERVDCCPEDCDQETCESEPKNCLFAPSEIESVPWCYVNTEIYGYGGYEEIDGESFTEWKSGSSIVGGDIPLMKVTTSQYENVFRIKLEDGDNPDRYQVPLELNLPDSSDNQFDAEFTFDPTFNFNIKRSSEDVTLFDTSVGGLTFADQFLEITTRVATTNVFGFGEHIHPTHRHSFEAYKIWPILARDEPPQANANLYSTHPFYLVVEEDGRAHGVLLWNSNAMEIVFLPAPAISLRSLGGIFDIFIIIGDSPEDVLQSYHQMIGTTYLPPYWSLGFQISRYGYDHIDNLQAAVDRTTDANIPLDCVYVDIDGLEEFKSFTYDEVNWTGLPEYLTQLHERTIQNIIIIDPFMVSNDSSFYAPYDTGLEMDVFVKWPPGQSPDYDFHNNDNLLGWAWPLGRVVFPDFLHVNSTAYWEQLIIDFHKIIPFDGLWLDMNEPANFGTNEEKPWNWPENPGEPLWSLKCPTDTQWDEPPYRPRSLFGNPWLCDKTICMTSLQDEGRLRHYDVHNLYGHTQTIPTLSGLQKAVPDKRGMVITRSTFPGTGSYGGRWLGDNSASWLPMKESIIGMMEFNMFGVPYVGADICGYFNDAPEELCQRWHQLGAFYPFSRNHNGRDFADQDPGMYSPEMQASTRDVINIRYRLLPYLYTLFYKSHVQGGTVVRPLFHEFPTDNIVLGIDEQFLWGPALLITPVLEEGTLEVVGYFPDARWFDYRTGEEIEESGTSYNLDAPLDYIPLHVRGGYILPRQSPGNTTFYSRLNTFELLVAPDSSGSASGDLFWDDGESVDTVTSGLFCTQTYAYSNNEVSMTITQSGSEDLDSLIMNRMIIFGVETEPSDVNIPGATISYDEDLQVLTLDNLQLRMNEEYTVFWT